MANKAKKNDEAKQESFVVTVFFEGMHGDGVDELTFVETEDMVYPNVPLHLPAGERTAMYLQQELNKGSLLVPQGMHRHAEAKPGTLHYPIIPGSERTTYVIVPTSRIFRVEVRDSDWSPADCTCSEYDAEENQ